jgi:hypothetical protein
MVAALMATPPTWDILGDGTLALRFPEELGDAVAHWISPSHDSSITDGRCSASIVLERTDGPIPPRPLQAPTVDAMFVDAWLSPDGESALLLDANRTVEARVDIGGLSARIRVRSTSSAERSASDRAVYAALRVSAALLLGRQVRPLLHAGALVDATGAAWLLAGGTHSGKTSTLVTLVRAGFDYVADDQVVLGRDPGDDSLRVRGWARSLMLDEGFEAGRSVGRRRSVDPAWLGPGRRVQAAPVAGLLFPGVSAADPTALEPISAPDAMGRVIRHSPWLLADRVSGRAVMRLLQRMASLPAFSLTLGADCFADAAALRRHLPFPLSSVPDHDRIGAAQHDCP